MHAPGSRPGGPSQTSALLGVSLAVTTAALAVALVGGSPVARRSPWPRSRWPTPLAALARFWLLRTWVFRPRFRSSRPGPVARPTLPYVTTHPQRSLTP